LREISLHIMDIAENGITAGADLIYILVEEHRDENRLKILIRDNGRGMPSDIVDKVTDPFYTSRKTRKVGMGLSLLKAAAHRCNGEFNLSSETGKGSSVLATFEYDHIDRAPLGDMANSIGVLIIGNQDVDFEYDHIIDGTHFHLDTRAIKKELKKSSGTDPAIYQHVVQTIKTALRAHAEITSHFW